MLLGLWFSDTFCSAGCLWALDELCGGFSLLSMDVHLAAASPVSWQIQNHFNSVGALANDRLNVLGAMK